MIESQTIAFIGGGNMAEAILSGLLKNDLLPPQQIMVADLRQERLEQLESRYGITPVDTNSNATRNSDIVVLAVKPQHFAGLAAEINSHLKPNALIISIMAGTTIETITTLLDHAAVVRTMPNTPAMVGEGMTVWTATDSVTDAQRQATEALLTAYGRAVYLKSEAQIDMATAMNGSGPAFIFLIMEAMADVGVQMGFTRDVALDLAIQTVLGSAKLAQTSDLHLAELRNRVTSPGGTTAAGLFSLEQNGLRATMAEAILASYRRSIELGEK